MYLICKKESIKFCIIYDDDNNSKTAGLSKQIIIKIGAKVMIRRNIDASLGLVNGTIATVISIVEDTSTNYVEKIKILLPSGMEYFIERVSVKFEVMDRAYVIRKQFPLCLSYGITIHKSQGLSLQSVIMDIVNSVFSCGQVYVALSRVTSIEGLNLINYDPSSIKASEEAIIEYNRLRQTYKAETAMITISKKSYCKIKDVLWALPSVFSSVQEPHQETRQNTAWVMNGFQNEDKVSCYANAVLQCLLHLDDIRKQLFISDKLNALSKLAHRYENGFAKLSTYAIRQYLGEYFSSNEKRDAYEFLTALCAKYDYIRNLLEYKVNTINRCKSCDNTKCITNNNIIISIPINDLKKKSYKLQDLINVTFSHWYQSFNESCEHCTGNNILFKNELILTQKIIAIRIILFPLEDGKLEKTHTINLYAVPTSKVLIAGQFYKVMNAIFHHGSSIDNGHYTSICREGTSSAWIEVDDMQIKKIQWARGAIYL